MSSGAGGYSEPMQDQRTQRCLTALGRARQMAQWSFGILVTSGRYMVHRVPFYRRNRRHVDEPELPDFDREVPGDPSTVQRVADGIGPLYHRRYTIAFTDCDCEPEDVVARLRTNLNAASPMEISRFEPVNVAKDGELHVGDEYVVRLPGPWDGPVRVIEATPASFKLATLSGHMEAGEIDFCASRNERGWIVFTIESWARSGNEWYHRIYHRLPLAREMQLHMWSHFCQRVATIAGGVVMTNVELHTCTPADWDPAADRGSGVGADPDEVPA